MTQLPDPKEVQQMIDQIEPMLHGKNPIEVGATLAWLTALWLSGHVRKGDPLATSTLQERLLLSHTDAIIDTVVKLQPMFQQRAERGEGRPL